jgi:hypothetical protein
MRKMTSAHQASRHKKRRYSRQRKQSMLTLDILTKVTTRYFGVLNSHTKTYMM